MDPEREDPWLYEFSSINFKVRSMESGVHSVCKRSCSNPTIIVEAESAKLMDHGENALSSSQTKWRLEESRLHSQISDLTKQCSNEAKKAKEAATQVAFLQTQLMGPRMERLRHIEQDLKDRIDEWALTEEKIEVHLHLHFNDSTCF